MPSPLKKVSAQNEKTWSKLYQRLSAMQFNYSEAMDDRVIDFLKNKAKSVGSSVGLLLPSVLTTTCYLLSSKEVKVKLSNTHQQPTNLYTILVGPPSIAKSPAMKEGVFGPLEEVLENSAKVLISNITSSGLTKVLHKEKQCYICSPEVYDVLNKLFKSDEDNATGDSQLLCKLFTGEKCTYHFSTEAIREIGPDAPFAILGATQVSNAAKLLCHMNNGHGLVDRFLFSFPPGFRPLPEEQEESLRVTETYAINSIGEIYEKVMTLHQEEAITYYFEEEAQVILKDMTHEHIMQVNEALSEGEVTPHTKKCDIIPRLALGIHVFQFIAARLLDRTEVVNIPRAIPTESLAKAIDYVNYLEGQKDTFLEVSLLSLFPFFH